MLSFMFPMAFAAAASAFCDDTSLLIQANMDRPQVQAVSNASLLNLRSLLITAKDQVLDSSRGKMTAASLGTRQLKLLEATNIINEKLKDLSSKNDKCYGTCITAIIVDAVSLMYQTLRPAPKYRCDIVWAVLWWVTGLMNLHWDGELTIPDAMHVLMQQFTSVGYGSDTPTSKMQKLFHGLHVVTSQMSVARLTDQVNGMAIDMLTSVIATKTGNYVGVLLVSIAAILLTSWYFHVDLKSPEGLAEGAGGSTEFSDAIYQALMTVTTVGYGDYSLQSKLGKTLSPFLVPLANKAFGKLTGFEWKNDTEDNSTKVAWCEAYDEAMKLKEVE